MDSNKYEALRVSAARNSWLARLMNSWARLLQDKKTLVSYFKKRNYEKIAIYGFGMVGETLERELRSAGIKVAYIVDRNAEYMYSSTKMVNAADDFEAVDVMVVTAFDASGAVINGLREKCNFKVISIDDVIRET